MSKSIETRLAALEEKTVKLKRANAILRRRVSRLEESGHAEGTATDTPVATRDAHDFGEQYVAVKPAFEGEEQAIAAEIGAALKAM